MAEVKYTRKETDAELNNVLIEDGQLIYTKEGHVYMDYDTDRIPMQTTPDNAMSDSSNNSVSNNVIKNYVDETASDINDIINEVKSVNEKKIIWTNPNPTNSFGTQTITLDESLNNYDCYAIIFKQSIIGNRLYNTGQIPVGHGTICFYCAGLVYWFRPTSDLVSGNTIAFEDAVEVSINNHTNTTDNSRVIPMYVIGYNTGLFE